MTAKSFIINELTRYHENRRPSAANSFNINGLTTTYLKIKDLRVSSLYRAGAKNPGITNWYKWHLPAFGLQNFCKIFQTLIPDVAHRATHDAHGSVPGRSTRNARPSSLDPRATLSSCR